MTASTSTQPPAAGQPTAELLDDEGMVTDKFLSVLAYIFSTFCFPLRPPTFALPEKTAHLPPSALDAFAIATNGEAFSKETKAEISTFFDGVDKDAAKDVEGGINFAGFEQMYTLQTESDPEETWRDLAAHGFDRTLELASRPSAS